MDNRTIRLSDAIEALQLLSEGGATGSEQEAIRNRTIVACIAALSALPAVEGWLPISDDAKSGVPVDLWVKQDGMAGTRLSDCVWISDGPYWLDLNTEETLEPYVEVTHWMPVPAPPIE